MLLLLLALSGCRHAAAKNNDEEKGPNVRVRVQPAAERTLSEKVTGLGRCEASPLHFAMLTAAAEGRVIDLLKRPGDYVKTGEPIVQLDATVAEKGLVEKQRALDLQKLAIDQAEVALKKAKLTTDHLRPLRQRGEISESALYDAESAQQQADLQLQTAKAQHQMAAAAIVTAKAQLAQLTIRTPIAGVLNNLTCQLGQTLAVGASVGEIVDAGQLQAVVWLTVDDARRLKPTQAASVRACGSSLDEAHDEGSPATVLDIGKMADPLTGNLPVRLKIDNAAGKLALGEAVMASITVHEEKALAVPAEAVRDTGDETVLIAVRDGKIAVLHPKLGLKDDGWIAVSDSDLKPGESVIIEGGYGLDKLDEPDKVKVEIAEPEKSAAEKPDAEKTGSEKEEKGKAGQEKAPPGGDKPAAAKPVESEK
jgi:RND family efflux transporter MFP subunit